MDKTTIFQYGLFVFGITAALRREWPKIDGRWVLLLTMVLSIAVAFLAASSVTMDTWRVTAFLGLQIGAWAIGTASGISYGASKFGGAGSSSSVTPDETAPPSLPPLQMPPPKSVPGTESVTEKVVSAPLPLPPPKSIVFTARATATPFFRVPHFVRMLGLAVAAAFVIYISAALTLGGCAGSSDQEKAKVEQVLANVPVVLSAVQAGCLLREYSTSIKTGKVPALDIACAIEPAVAKALEAVVDLVQSAELADGGAPSGK